MYEKNRISPKHAGQEQSTGADAVNGQLRLNIEEKHKKQIRENWW